jgi:hypothetical protein
MVAQMKTPDDCIFIWQLEIKESVFAKWTAFGYL